MAHRYAATAVSANPHYVHIENQFVPWTPLAKPVAQCTVALITMGGLHLPTQPPFSDVDNHGDPTFRALPRGIATGDYLIAHTHYSHEWVLQDMNCLLPLTIFAALEAEHLIGKLASTHYSFMGSLPNPLVLIADTAPEVARRLKSDQVDVCVLTPA